ncbi:hypothetical protein OQA88_5398 [Cercophora sp. LCS_1]
MGAPSPHDPGPIRRWHVDIDRLLNPFLPASVLPRLPHPVAHFLGYRSHPSHAGRIGNVLVIFWAAIGIFGSLAVIGAVGQQIPEFQARGVPVIIGSFGAAAVLDFYAIESPLAQPRNAILGQLVSAIVGVSVCKLFALGPDFERVRWLGGALACALATACMGFTNTVHPPAGATALMAVIDDDVARLGWFLIPPVLLGGVLMLAVALLVNNVQRRFPYYWWSPEEMGQQWKKEVTKQEMKRVPSTQDGGSVSGAAGSSGDLEAPPMVEFVDEERLVIVKGHVRIPRDMYLTFEEKLLLETLSQRIS